MTRIIFKVDASKGMCLHFVNDQGKVTRVIEGVDFRTHDIHVFAEKAFFIPGNCPDPGDEGLQEKSQEEKDKLFKIFKVN